MQLLTLNVGLFVGVACKAEWISPSHSKLPRADGYMAIGSYNNSIFLFGGHTAFSSSQLVEYNIAHDLFIDYGENILSIGIFGESSYYTQINNVLYFINHEGDALSSYDLKTNSLHSQFTTIPSNVGEYGCLASNIDYLFVIGGYSANRNLNIVQVLYITQNQWLDTVPAMQEARFAHSCIVDPSTNILYAIGGSTYKGSTYTYADTIEKISTNNIDQNNWSYIQSLSSALAWSRAVLYHHMIYMIGGGNGPDGEWYALDIVQVIDLITETVFISTEHLIYPVIATSAIIVGDTMYAFGGCTETYYDTWMMYTFSHASMATNHPTVAQTETSSASTSLITNYDSTVQTSSMNPDTQATSTDPSEVGNTINVSTHSSAVTPSGNEITTTIQAHDTVTQTLGNVDLSQSRPTLATTNVHTVTQPRITIDLYNLSESSLTSSIVPNSTVINDMSTMYAHSGFIEPITKDHDATNASLTENPVVLIVIIICVLIWFGILCGKMYKKKRIQSKEQSENVINISKCMMRIDVNKIADPLPNPMKPIQMVNIVPRTPSEGGYVVTNTLRPIGNSVSLRSNAASVVDVESYVPCVATTTTKCDIALPSSIGGTTGTIDGGRTVQEAGEEGDVENVTHTQDVGVSGHGTEEYDGYTHNSTEESTKGNDHNAVVLQRALHHRVMDDGSI